MNLVYMAPVSGHFEIIGNFNTKQASLFYNLFFNCNIMY